MLHGREQAKLKKEPGFDVNLSALLEIYRAEVPNVDHTPSLEKETHNNMRKGDPQQPAEKDTQNIKTSITK